MNNRAALFAQAARGPVLLITLGSLFALQQAGVIGFDRTWPALIIVLGLMKLAERLFGSPPMYPAGAPQQAPPNRQAPPYGQTPGGSYGSTGTYASSGTYSTPPNYPPAPPAAGTPPGGGPVK